jgi:fructokinase
VEVIDTVGAGDAFMAATLTQLADLDAFSRPGPGLPLDDDSLGRLLRGSIEVAAVTCERRGANPPRRQELPPGWPA